MFIAGDDDQAKAIVTALLAEPAHRGPGQFDPPGSGGVVPSLQVARCGHTRRTDRALASDLLMQ
jgi:hypothetical protein